MNETVTEQKVLIDVIPIEVKCHRRRTSISVPLGLHRNYICKEVTQNKDILFGDSFCSKTLSLPLSTETNLYIIICNSFVRVLFGRFPCDSIRGQVK